MRRRIAAWWISLNKFLGDWCEVHQHIKGRWGCTDCLSDSVKAYHERQAEEAEVKLRYEAQVYAEELVKALHRYTPRGHA